MKSFFTIDHGNTNPHIAHFIEGELSTVSPLKSYSKDFTKDHYIVSSVGPKEELPFFNNKRVKLENFWDEGKFSEMPVHYSHTLGEDRLVQSTYLFSKLKGQSTLLIDAGTFITFDCIDKEGLNGGVIIPGLQSLLDLYENGSHLPKISSEDFKDNQSTGLPQDTKKAMLNGLQSMILGVIQKTLQDFPTQNIILTGGNANLIFELLEKSNIKSKIEAHLIHYALGFLMKKVIH